MSPSFTTRFATVNDISVLVPLINEAYRPDPDATKAKVWTHEGHMFIGPRTDEAEMTSIISSSSKKQLVLIDPISDSIVGTIKIELYDTYAGLGMFAVHPDSQGMGAGKRLLEAAEQFAKEQNCAYIEMDVIKARTELVDFYLRRGYVNAQINNPILLEHILHICEVRDPALDFTFVLLRKSL